MESHISTVFCENASLLGFTGKALLTQFYMKNHTYIVSHEKQYLYRCTCKALFDTVLYEKPYLQCFIRKPLLTQFVMQNITHIKSPSCIALYEKPYLHSFTGKSTLTQFCMRNFICRVSPEKQYSHSFPWKSMLTHFSGHLPIAVSEANTSPEAPSSIQL